MGNNRLNSLKGRAVLSRMPASPGKNKKGVNNYYTGNDNIHGNDCIVHVSLQAITEEL